MIYRFRGNSSTGKFEIQLHAPSGLDIQLAERVARLVYSPLRYVGSIDSDFDGLIVPEVDDDDMQVFLAKAPESTCQDDIEGGIVRGWYMPGQAAPVRGKCVVEGCEQEAAFSLCTAHAAPGMIVQVGSKNKLMNPRVIVSFLVQTERGVSVFTIDDRFLGTEFGGFAGLKDRLTKSGYKVLGIISDEAAMAAAKKSYPSVDIVVSGSWFRDLVNREARPGAC